MIKKTLPPDTSMLLDRRLRYETDKKTKGIIRELISIQALSWQQRHTLENEWDEYYARARQTPAGLNYYAQAEAFKKGNMAEVKKRAAFARQLREEQDWQLAQPKLPDPRTIILSGTAQAYMENERKIASAKQGSDVDEF